MVRVFLVSNFRLMLHGIEALLAQHPQRFMLVGTAQGFDALPQVVSQAHADLVLLDIDFAPEQVLAAVEALHAHARQVPVLLLSRLADRMLQDRAVLAGARGVIGSDVAPELFLTALEKVRAGQIWLDREATGRIFVAFSRQSAGAHSDPIAERLAELTEREQDILVCLLRHSAEPGKAIARRLHISESTLRNHLTSIYDKFGVAGRNGLLAYAFEHRLGDRLEHASGMQRQRDRLGGGMPHPG